MNAARAIFGVLLGDLRRNPGAAAASVAAMAAGVGLFVAIYLASTAARSSFVSAVEAVSGRTTHEVCGTGGVAEERLADFAAHPGVLAAQPVVEGWVAVRSVRRADEEVAAAPPPLRILGLDPFLAGPFFGTGGGRLALAEDAEPGAERNTLTRFLTESGRVLLPRAWAEATGAQPGDRLVVAAGGRLQEWTVLALYSRDVLGESARDTALLDVAGAQEAFQREGRLSRIDLILREGAEQALRSTLGPGERLERPRNRGERVANLIAAFRLNLLALGGLALAVGALLVYNAAQFGVVRRRVLLGQLRCLGATQGLLFSTALGEACLYGLVGGAAGLALGAALAQTLAGSLARAITDLYAFVRVDEARLEWGLALAALAGALAIAALAAFFPALAAARAAPRLVGQLSRAESLFRARLSLRLACAALFGLLGGVAVCLPSASEWPGFVAAFSFLGMGAALLPAVMGLLLPALQRLGERRGWSTCSISAGTLLRSLSRTGGAAAALGVALAMTIGVVVMVSSFEREVRHWIEAAIHADLYVSDAAEEISREDARVPEEAVELIRSAVGVRGIDVLRVVEVPYADRSILFYGVDWSMPESRDRFEFIEGHKEEALDRALSGAVAISEPLSRHYRLHPGDVLAVPGRKGEERFEVAGVFRDYSHDRGFALTGKARFVAAFGDPGPRNVALYLQPGVERETVAAELRQSFKGRFELRVRSNGDLRARILDIFKRTFSLTYALQAIATLMALSGTAATLVGLFLERAREIATLRAVGMSRARIGGLFATEALFMALFPVLLALPLGALLAWVLLQVVNLRSFGWTIAFAWPWGMVLLTCALVTLASLIATLVPLALASRHSIAAALREE